MAHDILIVDDERDICTLIAGILEDEGHVARQAYSSLEAIEAIRQRRPSLVILDVWLQGSEHDGVQLLEMIKKDHPPVPVVMISGHGTIDTAVAAIKAGAYDFIEKPFKADRLLLVMERAVEASRLRFENEALRRRYGSPDRLVGSSPAISQLRSAIERIAPTGSRILISGPPGAGKETVAHLLHRASKRADGPLVTVNCARLPVERLEIELFGTDRDVDNEGLRVSGAFEQAHGGTLIINDIGEMPLSLQGRVVRVLQDLAFQRDGGRSRVEVDVRVIATSSRDLQAEVSAGRFREDLFYRINVQALRVPRLAERREDIPALARELVQSMADASGIALREIGADTLAALQAYDWPGNIRQLRNVIERLMIMAPADGSILRADMLPGDIGEISPSVLRWERGGEIMQLPLREAREVFEREYLMAQVTRFGGNISRTANFIGMERSALHRKLKSLGVHGTDDRPATEQRPEVP